MFQVKEPDKIPEEELGLVSFWTWKQSSVFCSELWMVKVEWK